jgi:hypothetical protein
MTTRGRDIDGSYKTSPEARLEVQTVREQLRAAGKCINGPRVGNVGRGGVEHGPVVRSGKCQRCIDIYRKSAGGYADQPKPVETFVELELALRAFRDGYAVATADRATKRHVIDPLTHKHWRRGYEAGRAALASDEDSYRKELNAS